MYGFLKANKIDAILTHNGANDLTSNSKTLNNVKNIDKGITVDDKYQMVSKYLYLVL